MTDNKTDKIAEVIQESEENVYEIAPKYFVKQ
jgi:hypothetical protein